MSNDVESLAKEIDDLKKALAEAIVNAEFFGEDNPARFKEFLAFFQSSEMPTLISGIINRLGRKAALIVDVSRTELRREKAKEHPCRCCKLSIPQGETYFFEDRYRRLCFLCGILAIIYNINSGIKWLGRALEERKKEFSPQV